MPVAGLQLERDSVPIQVVDNSSANPLSSEKNDGAAHKPHDYTATNTGGPLIQELMCVPQVAKGCHCHELELTLD